ncbi:AAA family ATPase [Methanobrevibacter oralis]|uniref:Archaeal ATPase n=2 Tax=Methanobrevibacter oralis TaxID=66851 RepID=A0A166AGY6_METOA|nr:ATP-binding protein [Methanobrevibacter oralis]KZX12019.1 archaeal ATPase [Methanobrevibacter oralis]
MTDLPWGNNQNLTDDEFYNRENELHNIKNLLDSTSKGHAPNLLLTGIRGVGKTVFLKKLKRQLDDEYLVVYIDFSKSECFQKNKMNINGLMEHYFKELIREAKNKKLNTLDKQIEKYFKSNDFKIKDFITIDKIPIPIFSKETNTEKLVDFVFDLPEKLYEKNKIKGILIFIDEFQIIKELNKYKESFLWKMRSYIQNQRNVAYIFSGSMSLQDRLISEIAGQNGAFGGRIISMHLNPFEKETVKSYLSTKAPQILFTDDGFDRFYKCTSGIPSYVNIFASLLPTNQELDENQIKIYFDKKIQAISSHLINIWTRLTFREQTIIIILLKKPLRRIDISNELEISPGSLSNYLTNLQNQGLILLNNNKYEISEPILKRWLELEFSEKGIYPYKQI